MTRREWWRFCRLGQQACRQTFASFWKQTLCALVPLKHAKHTFLMASIRLVSLATLVLVLVSTVNVAENASLMDPTGDGFG